ncbi:MAG: hypothetical protein M1816_007108 [Peltula sp. TS41687]|nr:MAG: hypothetical protein M1816_007108 [Peltula sp. TS41687]
MSSAAVDEVSRLFSEPKGPSMHPEDMQLQDRSRSMTPESDSHHGTINNNDHSRAGITSQPSYSLNDANTGPKGVIADARAFERAWLARRNSPSASNGVAGTSGGGMWPFSRENKRPGGGGSGRSSRHSTPERDSPQPRNGGALHDDHAMNVVVGDDHDEEFIQRWRNERLSELRGVSGQQPRSRRQSPSMRRYGRVETVDAVGYLDAIEKVAKETIVVVCIYDDESEISAQVEAHLSVLATKHTTTRFVKLHYQDAEMDPTSIPAILAYKQGELMANLVGIINEIPSDKGLTVASLEGVMRM